MRCEIYISTSTSLASSVLKPTFRNEQVLGCNSAQAQKRCFLRWSSSLASRHTSVVKTGLWSNSASNLISQKRSERRKSEDQYIEQAGLASERSILAPTSRYSSSSSSPRGLSSCLSDAHGQSRLGCAFKKEQISIHQSGVAANEIFRTADHLGYLVCDFDVARFCTGE